MMIKVYKPTKDEIEQKGIKDWPVWTCERSSFDWYYDERETCYIVEGDITVESKHETVNIGAGDMIIFPEGLSCKWNIKEPVKKHYMLG